jgi:hypothetical protein
VTVTVTHQSICPAALACFVLRSRAQFLERCHESPAVVASLLSGSISEFQPDDPCQVCGVLSSLSDTTVSTVAVTVRSRQLYSMILARALRHHVVFNDFILFLPCKLVPVRRSYSVSLVIPRQPGRRLSTECNELPG